MWEIEKGPDGLYDVFCNGRLQRVAMDADEVRHFLESRDVDLDDVEGARLLR